MRRRADVPAPVAYAVFDCETTGTTLGRDEIVSLAVVRVKADGAEIARFATLVRPSRPIPAEATAVHGIDDAGVASAPPFVEISRELVELLDCAVFVAHNASFDLGMLEHAFARAGIDYRPAGVACTSTRSDCASRSPKTIAWSRSASGTTFSLRMRTKR